MPLVHMLEIMGAEHQHDVGVHLALGIHYLQHALHSFSSSSSRSAPKGRQSPPSTGKLGKESEPTFVPTDQCQSPPWLGLWRLPLCSPGCRLRLGARCRGLHSGGRGGGRAELTRGNGSSLGLRGGEEADAALPPLVF